MNLETTEAGAVLAQSPVRHSAPTSPGVWLAISPTGEQHKLTVEQCMDFRDGPVLCVLCPNGWRTGIGNFIGWSWYEPND